jgi:hypothetical protein
MLDGRTHRSVPTSFHDPSGEALYVTGESLRAAEGLLGQMREARLAPGVMLAMMSLIASGCDETPLVPDTGTVEVATATTGDAIDADGYQLVFNDVESSVIGVNDTATLALDVGDYSVELTGLDQPCIVEGDNPVSITIVADETSAVSFSVLCEST